MSSAAAERRRALVVANARYDDGGLDGLASPARDAAALTEVLSGPHCGFEVGKPPALDRGLGGRRQRPPAGLAAPSRRECK
jgi:hypothetical protein